MKKHFFILTTLLFVLSIGSMKAQLSLSVSQTDPGCDALCDGSITCSTTGQQGFVEFSIDGGATFQFSNLFDSLCVGNYTVIARDSMSVYDSVFVTLYTSNPVMASYNVTPASSSVASDGMIDATPTYGGTPPYSFSWSNGQTGAVDSNLTTGYYGLVVTDVNGCVDSSQNNIFVDSTICSTFYVSYVLNSNASSASTCDGDVTIFPGGTAPYTYSWSNGSTSAQDSALCWGNYSVTVTDANGCIDSVVFFVDSTLCSGFMLGINQLNPDTSSSACVGYADIYFSGGSGIGTWTWTPGVSTSNFADSLCVGNYTVTYSDTYGCIDSISFFVDSIYNPCLNFSAAYGAVNDESSAGACDGYAEVFGSGGAAPYTYLWSNGATVWNPNNLCGGNNSVTVTDANGCADSVTVFVNTQGPCSGYWVGVAQSYGATSASTCNGFADISYAGVSPWTYQWSHDSTLNTYMDSNLCWGNYTVIVTDGNGCVDSVSFFIDSTYNPCSIYSINANYVYNEFTPGACDGEAQAEVYNGTPPYNYTWSNGASGAYDTTFCYGNQWLSISDANGCSDTIYFFIDSIPNPCAYYSVWSNVNDETGSCDGSAALVVDGGQAPFTYSWSTGATVDSISSLCQGAYGYTVTDANGCSYSDTAYVQLACIITPSISTTDETCAGANDGSITVTNSGGTAPYQYSIDGGTTIVNSNVFTGLAPGYYTVMTGDTNNCFGQVDSVLINAAMPFSIDTSGVVVSDASCAGNDGSITGLAVNGGTVPYTYNWNGGASGTILTLDLTGASGGLWSLEVTDNNGCVATSPSYMINQVSASISVSVSTTNVTCNGLFDGSATATSAGGTAPYSYQWSSGSGNAATANNLPADSGWVQVIDANGCMSPQTHFNITEPAPMVIVETISNENCGLNDGSISVTVSGGSAPYTYYWSTGDSVSSVSNLSAGIYQLTLEDAAGCAQTAAYAVTGNNFSVSSITTNPSCVGSNDGSIDITVTPGGSYTFLWSNGETTEDVSNLYAGFYTVTISDGNCQTVYADSISDPQSFSFVGTSSTPNSGCSTGDGSISVSVTGGTGAITTNLYGDLGFMGSGMSFNNLYPGGYVIVANDANGCVDSILVSVSSTPSTPMTVTLDNVSDATCTGSNETLPSNGIANVTVTGGQSPYQFYWRKYIGYPYLMSTSEDPTNLSSGNYVLEVVDAAGCSEFLTVDVQGANLAPQPICLVTVTADSLNNQQNIVVWEKNQGLGISEYEIWREEANGAWQLRGAVPFSQLSQFVDNGVDPNAVSYKYRLKTIDECNNVSVFQAEHRTIHLVANNYVPGTSSNNGSIDLSWNAYQGINGISNYNIERVTFQNGVETRVDVGTVAESGQSAYTFHDSLIPVIDTATTTLYYTIRVDLLSPCTATKAQSHNTTRSNRATISNGGGFPTDNTGVEELTAFDILIYPNPSQGVFNVAFDGNKAAMVVYDALGKVVYQTTLYSGVNAVDLSAYQNGYYYMSIINGASRVTKPIILQR